MTLPQLGPVAIPVVAGAGEVRPDLQLPCSSAQRDYVRLPGFGEPLPGAAVCAPRELSNHGGSCALKQ